MTKEEYKIQNRSLLDQKFAINKLLGDLENEYLSSQIEFKMGENVKITETYTIRGEVIEKVHIGFIRSFHTHTDGDTYYTFWKSKKDGTKSDHRLYLDGESYDKPKIERI